jgi:hypothetical protein
LGLRNGHDPSEKLLNEDAKAIGLFSKLFLLCPTNPAAEPWFNLLSKETKKMEIVCDSHANLATVKNLYQ